MAAQDAELQLKVSLDLAFFRQQLTGLGQAAAGTPLKLQVQFHRRSVQNELNALGTNIRRRNYRLNIETNLSAEIKKAKDLADALGALPKGGGPQRAAGVVEKGFTQAALKGLGQDIKALYKALGDAGLVEFNQAIANNKEKIAKELSEVGRDTITGLLNGLKSGDAQIKEAAKNLGQALIASIKGILGIASPSKVFKAIGEDVGKGFELGAVASMDKAFDALEQKLQERLKRLQSILSLAPSRRSAFPFVATGGALESGPIAREIDQAYAQIAQIQERRQGRLTSERGSLAQMAGRLLPPARDRSLPAARETIFPSGGALDQVTQGFVQSLKNTRETLARNFSANTYLPKATRALATSMDVATKQLTGTKIAGLLPSKEMMEPLRFQRAQQRAAQIDAENVARAQAEQALNQQNLRGMFKGLPPISAPMIGAENAPLSRAAQYSLNKANRLLGLPIGPSSPLGSMGQFPMSGIMGRGSLGQFPMDPMLAVDGASAMGQKIAGPYPWSNTLSSARGGYIRGISSSLRFPMSGMMGPSSPLGSITPQSSMFGGGGGMQPPGGGGGGGFRGAMGFGPDPSRINLSVFQQSRVPLTGAIAELTSEFANAAKQVLLFGTAYKALAFFTNLPNQAFEAAKALGTYKNQLQAVTAESNTFEQSFAFVDNLAQRFNVPLESARQGFVKLYASMEPAGFSQGQIEGLFEGISKATAAFGLSADKVDRVNYAFAQMASKGQIMSEELKGQLGDVLPGALALFAEAAQMSIPEFSKAMEDGALKGDAMAQVLDNVAILMNSKFGPAAQNASKTLQGALNEMQNNLKMMYESLTPFVNQFAAVFGPQISSLINDVTGAINILTGSFVSGGDALSTLSPRAEAIYKMFQQIGPSAVNAAQNIGSFTSSLQVFIAPLLSAAKGVLDFISLPVVARIGLYATIIASLNGAFQLLARTGILQATVAMVKFLATLNIAQLRVYIAGLQTLVAVLRGMITTVNIAKAAVVGLKVALGGIIVTAIFTGLDLLAQRLLNIGDSANKSKQNVRELAQELDQIAGSADIAAATQKYMEANTELAIARKKYQEAESNLGITRKLPVDAGGGIVDVAKAEKAASDAYADVIAATTKLRQTRQTRDTAVKRKTEEDLRTQQQLKPVDLSAGDRKTKKEKELDQYSQSQLDFIQQRFDKEKQILDQQLQLNLLSKTSYDIKLAELTLETKKAELNERFRLESEKINKANFSAADKALALKDEEIKKENAIAFAEKQRDIAVKGAKLELRQPFVEALRSENLEIDKQNALLGRLKDGYNSLTPEQEASFIIEEKIAALKADEQRLIQSDIDNLKKQIQLRLENLKILEKEEALRSARQEFGTIGAGLMAGFAGSAAGAFERTMIATEGDVGQATKLAEIETKAMQMRSVFEGIQGAIDGISGAFASMMTEGVTALVTGTATAKEVFASFLQSVAQALQQAASQMIATYVAIGIAKMFAGFSGGAGKGLDTSGFKQYPILPTPSAKGSYFDGPTAFFANGGIVSSPTFFQFADGGKMNMGLMGEAGPEAIMPLKRGPDGRLGISMYDASRKAVANAESNTGISSIDYEDDDSIGGTPSSRQALSSRAAQAVVATRLQVMEQRSLSEKRSEMRQIEEMVAMPAKINVEYQSQVINNVEYVTRDQAERMASQSALRGRELAIGALQNSIKTRKRVGMG